MRSCSGAMPGSAWRSWVPQCFGAADDPKVAAFCSSIRTTAKYDEANDEWVSNGQKAWATNGGIAATSTW